MVSYYPPNRKCRPPVILLIAQRSSPLQLLYELGADFEVLGFAAPLVVVRRRSDNMDGSLYFQHNPPADNCRSFRTILQNQNPNISGRNIGGLDAHHRLLNDSVADFVNHAAEIFTHTGKTFPKAKVQKISRREKYDPDIRTQEFGRRSDNVDRISTSMNSSAFSFGSI
jgi:hypothetical protein